MNYVKVALALIVLVYLCVGALYALKTPDWQVPDEPAHYNYIRQLAEDRRLPTLDIGDYDQDYMSRLTSERFPPELSLEAVEYEDHQPPLYYVLATPVYLVFDGALTPLRLFSVVLGAGVVLLAYVVAITIFPARPLIALGTAAFVAFLPQHVAMMAGVNNDSLAELLIGVTCWMTVRRVGKDDRCAGRETALRDEKRRWVMLGVVLGLGLVTKTTFLPIVPVVALAVLLRWWRDGDRTWERLRRALALVLGPALLIALPWWLRNFALYGGLDVYGLANHNVVVVGQPRTSEWVAAYGWRYVLQEGVTTTFQSFWGQFGWMGVLMPTWLYRALALCSGVLVVGIGYTCTCAALRRECRCWVLQSPERSGAGLDTTVPGAERSGIGYYPWHRPPGQVSPRSEAEWDWRIGVLGTTVLWVILAYLYYNCTFVQHQGRYLFPALIPIALGVALAVDGLLRLTRWPKRLRPLAFAIPYLALAALDLYALWRFILPALI